MATRCCHLRYTFPMTETRRTRNVLGGRSERVVEQVLAATIAELAVSGYRAFRMDHVSTEAGVNKTTIYRRWPGKAQLVAAAVERMRQLVQEEPLPNTGSLERDLVLAFRRKRRYGGRVEGHAWARLLAERHEPEVEALISGAVGERSGDWYAMITRAIARGELPEGTEPRLLLKMVAAVADAPPPVRLELAVRTIVAGAQTGTLITKPL
jgi:AcrR family transcriptional regulator